MSVGIIGAKGDIADPEVFIQKVNSFSQNNSIQVQVVDSKGVADMTHIELAFRQARRRFDSQRAISRSLPVEFLLYLGATHQINVAIDRVGVNETTTDMLFIILDGDANLTDLLDELGLVQQEPIYADDLKKLLEIFEITTLDEMDTPTVKRTIYEAVSLVNLEK